MLATQDELAETSIPDPGYAGTAWELDQAWYDFDLYEYWDDLEYGPDSYWDSAGKAVLGAKRKRGETVAKTPRKRVRLSLEEMSGVTSLFISMADRKRLWSRKAPVRKTLKSFALLPDWRRRCANDTPSLSAKAMPAEMRQAAEATGEETPEGERQFDADVMTDEGGEEDWEDENQDIGELMDGSIAELAKLADLDLDALQTNMQAVLKQKLGDAGLKMMREDMFMETCMKMLSGDAGADDAAGDLANSLLEATMKSENAGLSDWLSQQGVSLDQSEGEQDDEGSSGPAAMPESSSKAGKRKVVQSSPPDSAIEMGKAGRTAQLAVHNGSPKAAKRKSPQTARADDGLSGKRKKVASDMSASQDSGIVGEVGNEGERPDSASSGKPPAAGPPVSDEPFSTAAPKSSKPSSGSKTDARTAEAVVHGPGPANSTRKRKAQAEVEEPPPPKKQTRKAASSGKADGDDGQPSYARPTRATRARSGK